MLDIILFAIAHFAACMLFFLAVQKPTFMLYNQGVNTEEMKSGDVRDIYQRGYVTDMIASAYLSAVPVIVLWGLLYAGGADLRLVVSVVEIPLAVVAALATVADTALYKFWKFKLDSSALVYLRSLRGAFASVSKGYIAVAILAILAVAGGYFGLMSLLAYFLDQAVPASDCADRLWLTAGGLLACGMLFASIRGVHRRPNNPTVAYFSKNQFYNHCALNPLYSFIYSLSVKDNFGKQFQEFPEEQCRRDFEGLFPTQGEPQEKLLTTDRPNILLVIWESLSARFISTLGGESGVMPCFERLSEEGVLFARCDAGSFRTDRGLVCILSGYLGQPTTSVIRCTRKLPNLPALPRKLRDLGYQTTAIHGGNCQIMHKSDYYLASGHDTLIAQKDLPKNAPTCAWGIPDGYMFDYVYSDIERKTKEGRQWFTTLQTLSSHEPFDVPQKMLDDKVRNAFAYADDCFGNFIEKLKKSPAWSNTLVIVTGDHGFNSDEPLARNLYPHIPWLMLGGVIAKPMRIEKIVAQTDIAATLLGQMHIDHSEFLFSRDVMAGTYTYPFALHTYNNGFLFRDNTGWTHYDNVAAQAIEGQDERREHTAKVILQTLYKDLDGR